MRMTIWKISLIFLAVLCPSAIFAAPNLAIASTAELIAYLDGANQSLCIKPVATTENPLPCIDGTLGGNYTVAFGSSIANGHVVNNFNSSISFTGGASVDLSDFPRANTTSGAAGFTLQLMIGPQVLGDTFSFTVQQTSGCTNSHGPCVVSPVSVFGATSVKGTLEKGQKIISSQPVVISFSQLAVVGDPLKGSERWGGNPLFGTDPAANWLQTFGMTLVITPRKEASSPSLLDDDDDNDNENGR